MNILFLNAFRSCLHQGVDTVTELVERLLLAVFSESLQRSVLTRSFEKSPCEVMPYREKVGFIAIHFFDEASNNMNAMERIFHLAGVYQNDYAVETDVVSNEDRKLFLPKTRTGLRNAKLRQHANFVLGAARRTLDKLRGA